MALFFIKKNQADTLMRKFWDKVKNFCFTIGITAGLLIFFRQQRVFFLSMPFILLLLFIGALIWLYFIAKYVFKTIPARREEQEKRALKEKYL
jgi:hypothetical protein